MWSKYFSLEDICRFSGGEMHFPGVSGFCLSDNLPQWHYPWHMHPRSVELIFAAEGHGLLNLDNQTFPMEKGDIAFIPMGIGHMITSPADQKFTYYGIGINVASDGGSFCPPSGPLQDFFTSTPCTVTSGLNSFTYIAETFRLLLSLFEMSGGVMTDTMKALFYSLFTLTRELFTTRALTVRIEQGFSMTDIIQYINQHSSDPLTLQSIADHFHLSPSHLSRLFSRAYHSSPISYLISVRLATACDLLLTTNKPVSEVAAAVGYDNFSHFNVLFRKHIGCTPNEFRTRARPENPNGFSNHYGHSILFVPHDSPV